MNKYGECFQTMFFDIKSILRYQCLSYQDFSLTTAIFIYFFHCVCSLKTKARIMTGTITLWKTILKEN